MIAAVTAVGAAIALAGTIASGLLWWFQRKAAQKDDPKNQSEAQKQENRDAVADGTAGDLLNRRLNRLPDPTDKGSGPK